MNLTLFLTAFSPLIFTMSWRISKDPHQDLFILNGVNNSAYFFRRNKTFYLHLDMGQDNTVLQYNGSFDYITFSWADFTINNNSMCDKDVLNYYTLMDINTLTFINPEPFEDPCSETYTSVVQPTYIISGVNYGYIVLVCLATILANKIFGASFIKTLTKKLNQYAPASDLDVCDDL